MLDTRADRERFGLHKHAALREHFKGIPCGVTERKDERCGFFFSAGGMHTFHAAARYFKSVKLCFKSDLAAEADNTLPYRFNDSAQIIGAYVRLCFCAYLLRCAEFNESFKDIAAKRVVDARSELAVGERTCAALSELDVGVFVEAAAFPEALDGLCALFHVLAAFKNYRLIALLCECECAEHSRRSKACDDNSAVCFFARDDWCKVRRCGISEAFVFLAQLFFKRCIGKFDEHRADVVDIILLACIERYFVYLRGLHEAWAYAQ